MTTRTYTQTRRADATEQTRRAILDAAQALFRDQDRVDPGLELVAERAGCSTRSVIRHFGSKEGLVEAAIADGVSAKAEARWAEPGDIAGAVRLLVDHYEEMGDDVVGWLTSAERYPLAKRVTETGTAMHREWVEAVFAPDLEPLAPAARRARRAALATVTDVYVWQLLRRREGLGRTATEAAILTLVESARGGGGPEAAPSGGAPGDTAAATARRTAPGGTAAAGRLPGSARA
jgi:AcrR family transcriptional regulator